MSRIGKKLITILKGVDVKITNNEIFIKGSKGEFKYNLPEILFAELKDGSLKVFPKMQRKDTNALWGTARALLANMILGVSRGFEKKLEIEGIGFKAVLDGRVLVLNLGFSHQVKFKLPDGVDAKAEKNIITISGSDKNLVGQTAANIRALKKPEPYKGKGIKYQGEIIRRKAGKKATAAAK